jgi:hypothetical protein
MCTCLLQASRFEEVLIPVEIGVQPFSSDVLKLRELVQYGSQIQRMIIHYDVEATQC